jgi:hypothetical protein
MAKRKKNLTPEEIEKLRLGLEQIRRDLREVLALVRARLGDKPT